MNLRSKRFAWPLAATLLLTAGVLATLGVRAADDKKAAAAAASGARPALTVTVVQAQTSTLGLRVPANGSIAAWQEAIVGAEGNGLRLA